jgi:D-alanine--poly(phosphoribitol) ligase subunit 2
MIDRILPLILAAAREMNEQLENKIPLENGPEAPLFGAQGVLDSLGLVTLLVAVEQAIEEAFGIPLVLADEKALSRGKSPFRTVGALAQYIEERIQKAA